MSGEGLDMQVGLNVPGLSSCCTGRHEPGVCCPSGCANGSTGMHLEYTGMLVGTDHVPVMVSWPRPCELALRSMGVHVPVCSQRVCTATCPSAKVPGTLSWPPPSAHILHDLALAMEVIVMVSL